MFTKASKFLLACFRDWILSGYESRPSYISPFNNFCSIWFGIILSLKWDFWKLLNFLITVLENTSHKIHWKQVGYMRKGGFSVPQSWARFLKRQWFGHGEKPYQRIVNLQCQWDTQMINHAVWVLRFLSNCVIVRYCVGHRAILSG